MTRVVSSSLEPEDLGGFKYLRMIHDLLEPLRERHAHGNRDLFMDQYASLLLLYFFNPVLTSLRGLQHSTSFANVQEATGVRAMSLGALSKNAGHLFDPQLLVPILQAAAARAQEAQSQTGQPTLDAARLRVIAADGSFLKCLPSMIWAVFRKQTAHRGVKLHLQLDVRTGLPLVGQITDAMSSEKKALAKALRSEAIYLLDRGYSDYSLFQKIHDQGSFFVARVKETLSYEVTEERVLDAADASAGVLVDHVVKVGSTFTAGILTAPTRRLVIESPDEKRIVLLTNSDLPAYVVANLYRWRWQVEMFQPYCLHCDIFYVPFGRRFVEIPHPNLGGHLGQGLGVVSTLV